jgi:hypothetical protein
MRRPPPGRQSQCEGLTTEEESPFLMDTRNPSAPPHAHTRVAGKNHPNRHPIGDPIVELIAQGLGKHPAAEQWRNLVAVDLSFYKSHISEEIRAEGEARRAVENVLEVLEVRGIGIPEAVRERIVSCGDPETLRRWHRRAVIAPSAEQTFSEEQGE